MKDSYFSLVFFTALIFAVINCARITGSPQGGPKDEDPPVVIKTFPENETLNFDEKKIKIYFDEYVKISNPRQNLVMSPPLKFFPEIKPSSYASKSISVKIFDTLRKQTTYVIDFGQSLADFNEGNILRSFKYVFSTGDYIDSLTFRGKVRSAYKIEKEKFITAVIYEQDSTYNDSAIYKLTPNYVASTIDTLPDFEFTYLKSGTYKLFAIKDKNGDNKYSPETDEVAFYDEVIQIPVDTTTKSYKYPELKLFKEKSTLVEIRYPSLVSKNRILFGYRGVRDSVKIELMSETPEDFKYKILKDPDKDTLNYWMTPVQGKLDSMIFRVLYNTKPKDTFTIQIRKLYSDSLIVTPNIERSMSIKDSLFFMATTPLAKFNKDSLFFVDTKDTLDIPYKAEIDSVKNRLWIDFVPEMSKNYALRMLPGTLTDMFGETNDTISLNLNIPPKTEYGNIYFKIYELSNFPVIFQITDSQGKVVEELYAKGPQDTYDFELLKPQKYRLRLVFDKNNNQKWDTGNLLKHRQPEDIYYFPAIDLRANWDLNQEFLYDPNSLIGKEVKSSEGSEDSEKQDVSQEN